MFLGRVKGHVVSTAKDPTIVGCRLLIIEPLKVAYEDEDAGAKTAGGGGTFEVTGRAIIAMDNLGAGEGQLVMIVQGSSARLAQGLNNVPADAVVIGIVDEAMVCGKRVT